MNQLLGGTLIGIAVTVMLLFNGRVTGISGIIGQTLDRKEGEEWYWRIVFMAGLVSGGLFLKFVKPISLSIITNSTIYDFIFAGFLVGLGSLMANGCTSGHGVCGISRFSLRSIVATVLFIAAGMVSVILYRVLRGAI